MKFPCKICAEDHLTYKFPRLQECTDFIAHKDSRRTPAVLQNPFSNPQQQQQHMVANPSQPPQRGNGGLHPSGEGPSAIYGIESVDLQTRTKLYGNPTIDAQEPGTSSYPPPPNDLHIERPTVEPVIRPPKGTLRRTTHNTSARAAQNYNIVEDLAHAPSAMSTLEVLQTCPAKRKPLLLAIGGIDP